MHIQDKFFSDIQRLVSKNIEKEGITRELKRLFIGSSPADCVKCGLAEDLFSFWAENYSGDFSSSYKKLGEIISLLYGEEEEDSVLSSRDWEEIRELVSSYGDSLDLTFLTEVMNIILKHWKI